MSTVITKVKDKASGQLNAGILAGSTSIALQSGQGANFPQPYSGTATSLGTVTTLNSTSIGSSGVAVGDLIRNVTDGSWAFITVVATHSVTTSRLKGGSANIWANSDAWRVNEFVGTLATITASGTDTAYEEVLCTARSTDTLTVSRAYNGTTAQAFSASDYFQLRVTAPNYEEMKSGIKDVQTPLDLATTNIATAQTDITTLQTETRTGSYLYVVTTGSANAYVVATPALGSYAAGNIVRFKANFTNSGAATINVNSLGAKSIKKNDGATALAANDIISGQIVTAVYDGTNFQMLSPVGTPATITHYHKTVYLSGTSSSANANPTSNTAFDTHTYTIPANDITATVGYEFEFGFTMTIGAGQLDIGVMLDGTALAFISMSAGGLASFRGFIVGTAAAGASVPVRGTVSGGGNSTTDRTGNYVVANYGTTSTLAIVPYAKFGTSNGGNTITCTMARIAKISTSAFA